MILRLITLVLALLLPPAAAAVPLLPPADIAAAPVAAPAQAAPLPSPDAARPDADAQPETAPAAPAPDAGAATDPSAAAPEAGATTDPSAATPTPAPEDAPPADAPAAATPAVPAPATPPSGNIIVQPQQPQAPALPTILRAEADMPEPVRRTWQRLMEAARSGDIERLRPLMEEQKEPPDVAFDAELDDPIDYLRSLSGDAEGREILAIMLEVLEAGFVHADAGTPQELYVWPYFAHYPMDALTPEQMVEMFTLLTAGDYQEMRSYGAYIFFRLGIAPDGTWRFFVAGD